jgi:hypothetical protein
MDDFIYSIIENEDDLNNAIIDELKSIGDPKFTLLKKMYIELLNDYRERSSYILKQIEDGSRNENNYSDKDHLKKDIKRVLLGSKFTVVREDDIPF